MELIHFVTHPDGQQERQMHAFPLRDLFRNEAEHLLVRCGLAVEAPYAGHDRAPYRSHCPGELIFAARKA